MGAREIHRDLDAKALRRRVQQALLAQGSTAEALERASAGVGLRACGPDIRAVRGFPPALDERQQGGGAGLPEQAGIQLANVLERSPAVCLERFGTSLSRSSCLKTAWDLQPSVFKADQAKRKSFALAQRTEARLSGAELPKGIRLVECMQLLLGGVPPLRLLEPVRKGHAGPLNVIWDNAPKGIQVWR